MKKDNTEDRVTLWLTKKTLPRIFIFFFLLVLISALFYFEPELYHLLYGKSYMHPENRRAIGVAIFVIGVISLQSDIRIYFKETKKGKQDSRKVDESARKKIADSLMEQEIKERSNQENQGVRLD
ncbi:MAG: hypothetical protein ACMZ63_08835 [Methylotenera sp.]